jgi:hypothetical protein
MSNSSFCSVHAVGISIQMYPARGKRDRGNYSHDVTQQNREERAKIVLIAAKYLDGNYITLADAARAHLQATNTPLTSRDIDSISRKIKYQVDKFQAVDDGSFRLLLSAEGEKEGEADAEDERSWGNG